MPEWKYPTERQRIEPKRKGEKITVVIVAIAVACTLASVGLYTRDLLHRRDENAVTVLSNCLQIEQLKTTIRATLIAGTKAGLATKYYAKHPDERKKSLALTAANLRRFHKIDCYTLPTVKSQGLEPPAT